MPNAMSDRDLIAYIATLIALFVTLLGSMLIAAWVPGVLGHIADFGIGTITGGLIGVLRLPTRAGVNVEQAGQVGPNGASAADQPSAA